MRRVMCLLMWFGCVGSLSAGTISYDASNLGVSSLGQTTYRLTFTISNFTLATNQEVDIQFDPTTYASLSNGVAPVGFNVILLQPGNPMGAFGVYSAVAQVDNPSLTGRFSVDVLLAMGAQLGVQDFAINQLDQQGVIVSTISTGATVAPTSVPEPATFSLIGLALLTGGGLTALRGRIKKTV